MTAPVPERWDMDGVPQLAERKRIRKRSYIDVKPSMNRVMETFAGIDPKHEKR